MFGSTAPDDPAHLQPGTVHAQDGLAMLAAVARAVGALAPDAPDETLLAVLRPILVPAASDLCLLYVTDASEQLTRIGGLPGAGPLAQKVAAAHQDFAPELGIYEPLLEAGHPVLMPYQHATGELAAEHWSFVQAAGLAWELVVPLAGGADGEMGGGAADALLVLDGSSKGRALEPTTVLQLAEVLGGLIGGWRAARALRQRAAEIEAALEETAFAGRELAHTLNNSLTMPVGVIELLLDGGVDSPELREMIAAAASDLTALENHIRAYQNLMRTRTGGQIRPGQHLPPP
ncbi:MAG: hypothetical protein IT306_20305 [Chloroflexi bacterium]|nr:hypothetical protein [Chloroflexota bacterium]